MRLGCRGPEVGNFFGLVAPAHDIVRFTNAARGQVRIEIVSGEQRSSHLVNREGVEDIVSSVLRGASASPLRSSLPTTILHGVHVTPTPPNSWQFGQGASAGDPSGAPQSPTVHL